MSVFSSWLHWDDQEPVQPLLGLYLQNGGVVVQDGQDDFVHVLSQAQVDFLLLLQSFH